MGSDVYSIDNLRSKFEGSPSERPDLVRIQQTTSRVLVVRQKRVRRISETVVAAVVVAILAVSISLLVSRPTEVSAPSDGWTASSQSLESSSGPLIPFGLSPMMTPVTVVKDAPSRLSMDWTSNGSELAVSWGPQSTLPGTLGSADTRGYTISAAQEVPISSGNATQESVRINDSDATLTTGGSSPDPTVTGIFSNQWLTWRLGNGHFIHVWATGMTENDLVSFASTIIERAAPLPAVISVGASLPGLKRQVLYFSRIASHSTGNVGVQLCPSTAAMAVGTGGQPATSSEDRTCLQAQVYFGQTSQVQFLASQNMLGAATLESPIGELHYLENRAFLMLNATTAVSIYTPVPLATTDLVALMKTVQFDPHIAAG